LKGHVKAPLPSNRFNVYNRHQKAHFRPPSPKITAVLVQLFTSGRTGHVIRGQRDILPLDISIAFIFVGEGPFCDFVDFFRKPGIKKKSDQAVLCAPIEMRAQIEEWGVIERFLSLSFGFTYKKGT